MYYVNDTTRETLALADSDEIEKAIAAGFRELPDLDAVQAFNRETYEIEKEQQRQAMLSAEQLMAQ